jgi:hypothetical protein
MNTRAAVFLSSAYRVPPERPESANADAAGFRVNLGGVHAGRHFDQRGGQQTVARSGMPPFVFQFLPVGAVMCILGLCSLRRRLLPVVKE